MHAQALNLPAILAQHHRKHRRYGIYAQQLRAQILRLFVFYYRHGVASLRGLVASLKLQLVRDRSYALIHEILAFRARVNSPNIFAKEAGPRSNLDRRPR